MRPIVALSMLALTLPAVAPAAGEAPKGDLPKLQGRWTGAFGPNKDIPFVVAIKDKALTLTLTRPDGETLEIKGEIKLDDQASPKTFDWVKFTRPDGAAIEDSLSIYKLEGDTLTLCTGAPGGTRPTEFKAAEGNERFPQLQVLKRKVD